jgi:hypothetical protein
MAFSTFDGPVLVGPVKYGTQAAATGLNTGSVVLAQSGVLPAAPGATTIAVLPAGSRIIDFDVDVPTQFNSATTLTIGDGTTPDKYLASAIITGAAATNNRILRSVIDPKLATGEMVNVGTSPVRLVATTGSTTATVGAARVTVRYIMRDSAGNARPTQA